MRNAGLNEAQAGIKIGERNVNNLKYADDTNLMAESEELKSLLMKVKEESEKSWFKIQHSKNWDHGIWSHHFMEIVGKTVETLTNFIFLSFKIAADGECSHEIKTHKLWQT